MKKPMKKQASKRDMASAIRRLRRENEEKSRRIWQLEGREARLRDYIDSKFSWLIDVMAAGNTPNIAWLVKDIKDFLVRSKV